MRVVKMCAVRFRDAVLATSSGIRSIPRLVLVSTQPFTATIEPVAEVLKDAPVESVMRKMLLASGCDHAVRLEGAPYAFMLSKAKDEHGKECQSLSVLSTPVTILTKHADFKRHEDYLPIEVLESMLPDAKFREGAEVVDMDEAELLRLAQERLAELLADQRADGGGDTGLPELLAEGDRLLQVALGKSGEQIETVDDDGHKIKARIGEDTFIGRNRLHAQKQQFRNGSTMEYVPANISDFTDVSMTTPNGIEGVHHLRVFHDRPPTWHAESPSPRFAGYWQFDRAVIGEPLEGGEVDGQAAHVVGFVTIANLRVLAKSAEVISPGGRAALPKPVWDEMVEGTDAVPERLMTESEGDEYNRQHAISGADAVAMSATNNKGTLLN